MKNVIAVFAVLSLALVGCGLQDAAPATGADEVTPDAGTPADAGVELTVTPDAGTVTPPATPVAPPTTPVATPDAGSTPSTPALVTKANVVCSLINSGNNLRLTITGLDVQNLWWDGKDTRNDRVQAAPIAQSDLTVVSASGHGVLGWSTSSNPSYKVQYSGPATTHILDVPVTNRFNGWVWSNKDAKAYWFDLLRVTVSGDTCQIVADGQGGLIITR